MTSRTLELNFEDLRTSDAQNDVARHTKIHNDPCGTYTLDTSGSDHGQKQPKHGIYSRRNIRIHIQDHSHRALFGL